MLFSDLWRGFRALSHLWTALLPSPPAGGRSGGLRGKPDVVRRHVSTYQGVRSCVEPATCLVGRGGRLHRKVRWVGGGGQMYTTRVTWVDVRDLGSIRRGGNGG